MPKDLGRATTFHECFQFSSCHPEAQLKDLLQHCRTETSVARLFNQESGSHVLRPRSLAECIIPGAFAGDPSAAPQDDNLKIGNTHGMLWHDRGPSARSGRPNTCWYLNLFIGRPAANIRLGAAALLKKERRAGSPGVLELRIPSSHSA